MNTYFFPYLSGFFTMKKFKWLNGGVYQKEFEQFIEINCF